MTQDEIAKLIPENVVEAARDAYHMATGNTMDWMRASLAAGLAAWGGMEIEDRNCTDDTLHPFFVMPVKEEPTP